MKHDAITRRVRRGIIARLMLKVCLAASLLLALIGWLVFPNAAVWAGAADAVSATSARVRLAALKVLGGKPSDAGPEVPKGSAQLDSMKKANGFAAGELRCLAVAIYFDAGAESREGQLAVGQIVLNRARDRKAPRELCRVVYNGMPHACLFDATCRNLGTAPASGQALAAAIEVSRALAGGEAVPGRLAGATHFHDRSQRPAWARGLFKLGSIGRLEFYSTEQSEDAVSPADAAVEKADAAKPAARRPPARPDTARPHASPESKSLARQVFGTD